MQRSVTVKTHENASVNGSGHRSRISKEDHTFKLVVGVCFNPPLPLLANTGKGSIRHTERRKTKRSGRFIQAIFYLNRAVQLNDYDEHAYVARSK
jgi:hypothetical protein